MKNLTERGMRLDCLLMCGRIVNGEPGDNGLGCITRPAGGAIKVAADKEVSGLGLCWRLG